MCGIAELTLCTETKKGDGNKMPMPPKETTDACTHTYRQTGNSFVSLSFFFNFSFAISEAQWLPRKSIVAVNMQVPDPWGQKTRAGSNTFSHFCQNTLLFTTMVIMPRRERNAAMVVGSGYTSGDGAKDRIA